MHINCFYDRQDMFRGNLAIHGPIIDTFENQIQNQYPWAFFLRTWFLAQTLVPSGGRRGAGRATG